MYKTSEWTAKENYSDTIKNKEYWFSVKLQKMNTTLTLSVQDEKL